MADPIIVLAIEVMTFAEESVPPRSEFLRVSILFRFSAGDIWAECEIYDVYDYTLAVCSANICC